MSTRPFLLIVLLLSVACSEPPTTSSIAEPGDDASSMDVLEPNDVNGDMPQDIPLPEDVIPDATEEPLDISEAQDLPTEEDIPLMEDTDDTDITESLCPWDENNEDWSVYCGRTTIPIPRTLWGEGLREHNQGISLPSGRILDTENPLLVAEAIARGESHGTYPPSLIFPRTDDWPDAYDVGNILCPEYELCWGWNDLDFNATQQTPETIVVHYTAGTHQGRCADYLHYVFHLHTYTNGWGDIGYNFFVCEDSDGVHTYSGRWSGNDPETNLWASQYVVGAHSPPNTGTVGVALTLGVGEQPTLTELEHYKRTIARIALDNDIPPERVVGHLDRNATECPGALYPLLPEIRQRVRDCHVCADF